MIPDLPPSCSDEDSLRFYSNLLSRIENQSTVHINWHTHKGNPSVCWICDLMILSQVILNESQRIYSKSSLDIETSKVQEKDSEPEIEEKYIGDLQ